MLNKWNIQHNNIIKIIQIKYRVTEEWKREREIEGEKEVSRTFQDSELLFSIMLCFVVIVATFDYKCKDH